MALGWDAAKAPWAGRSVANFPIKWAACEGGPFFCAAMPVVRCGVAMLNRRAFLSLAATPLLAQEESGFQPLCDGKSLQGWQVIDGPESAFYLDNGEIVVSESGNSPTWLATTRSYENFELRCDFYMKGWIDSGIYLHAPVHGHAMDSGFCIKLFHKEEPPKPESMGAIFPVLAPKLTNVKSKGDWNSLRIVMDWPRLQVWSNGAVVQDVNVDQHPELKYRLRDGRIGLQSLSYPIRFRNLRIKELPSKTAWTSLYNEPADFEKNWFVEEGKAKWLPLGPVLRADNVGHLATKAKYKDFAFECFVRAQKHSNGGIIFRAEGSGAKPHFEIQLHDVEGAVYPTGSLYHYRRAKYPRIRSEEWYLLQLFVKDRQCVVRINGETVVDYPDLDRGDAGYVMLQAHQNARWVEYKGVRIREI